MDKPSPQEWFELPAEEAAERAAAMMRDLAREYSARFAARGFTAMPLTETPAMQFAHELLVAEGESRPPEGRWFSSACESNGGFRLGVREDGSEMAANIAGIHLGSLVQPMLTSGPALAVLAARQSSDYRPAGLVLAELVSRVQDALESWAQLGTTQDQLASMAPAAAREALLADINRMEHYANWQPGSDYDVVAVRFKHDTDVVVYNDMWATIPAGTVTVASRERNGNGRWMVHVPSRQGTADMRKSDVEFLEDVPS